MNLHNATNTRVPLLRLDNIAFDYIDPDGIKYIRYHHTTPMVLHICTKGTHHNNYWYRADRTAISVFGRYQTAPNDGHHCDHTAYERTTT